MAPDGTRKTVRLGKVSRRDAEAVKYRIENLVAARMTGTAIDRDTAGWVANLPDMMRRRLESVRLILPREGQDVPSLGQWLSQYVESREDVGKATKTVYGHTKRNLLAFLGEDKAIDAITPGDADAFRVFLKSTEKLAENTVRRRMGIAKQFFRAAIRRKIIPENPFDGHSTCVRYNPERFYFVSQAEAQAVIDACPNAQWRLVFALCRYGGLRCASEVARLKWEDINWEKMRFTVHAKKTKHHADAGIRIVPIFPELYPSLRDAFEEAEPGVIYCCPQYAPSSANQMYRKNILRAVHAAGLKPWPKLFQNLRSTRETELAEQYPVQVVCAWIGNSPQVAARHYLQVTEDHFNQAAQKAAQNPAQYVRARGRTASQDKKSASDKG